MAFHRFPSSYPFDLIFEHYGMVYRFRHILLRGYLAGLTDAQLDDLARDL
ncbi:MAG TPA: hypothetical protein VFS21_17815 [Roseiflexaceae bacterium]|nr:hypothetical protein [Roseiflexaceae bacterium]